MGSGTNQMHLRSVETTPNPTSMKLNLHEELPLTATYTLENKSGCPDFVELLLQIDGVKSVFVCHDFITVNRDPRTDWQPILEKATAIFSPGELEAVKTSDSETAKVEDEIETHRNAFEKEGQVHVLVQTFRGVPIQVKTTDGQGESRVSLG